MRLKLLNNPEVYLSLRISVGRGLVARRDFYAGDMLLAVAKRLRATHLWSSCGLHNVPILEIAVHLVDVFLLLKAIDPLGRD